MNGESPAFVRDQLGHSSIRVTIDMYGRLIPGVSKAAMDWLDEMCKPGASRLREQEDAYERANH
jgi:hypothetical protein